MGWHFGLVIVGVFVMICVVFAVVWWVFAAIRWYLCCRGSLELRFWRSRVVFVLFGLTEAFLGGGGVGEGSILGASLAGYL